MFQSRSRRRNQTNLARYGRSALVEQLERRTLLSAAVIDPSADNGLYLNNSAISSDTLVISGGTFSGNGAHGIAIDLNGVVGLNSISVNGVTASSNGDTGIIISLKNMTIDSLLIQATTVNGNIDPGISLVFDNVTIQSLTIVGVTATNNVGPGICVTSTNSTIQQISVTQSTVTGNTGDGMRYQMTGGGVTQFLLTDNVSISNNIGSGVAFALTNAPIATLNIERNTIQGNSAGSGVKFTLDNSHLAGAINNNQILNNSAHGIEFTPTATANLIIDFGNIAAGRMMTGNTISGNGGAGIQSILSRFVDFRAQLGGNTISSNGSFGWYTGGDRTAKIDVEFGNTSLASFANVLNANRDAAVGFDLTDDVTGRIVLHDVTTTNTVNGANVLFDGEGIKVRLSRRASLSQMLVDHATIGGNAADGVGVELIESTNITDFTVFNSTITNNFNGIAIERFGPASIAVMIDHNMVTQNRADGLNVFLTNRKTPVLRFGIYDNKFDENVGDGVDFSTFADSISVATAKRNSMSGNGGHGLSIQTNQDSAFGNPGDTRINEPPETSVFENNAFDGNALDGVHSVANNNSRQLIRFDSPIDLAATTPTRLMENGDDGFSFESFGTTVTTISILGSDVMLNADDAVVISLNEQASSTFVIGGFGDEDDNNLGGVEPFEGNGGDGLDVDTRGGTVSTAGSMLDLTVVGNRIQYNGGNGARMQHRENSQVDALFDNNTIKANGARGVDILLNGFVGERVNEGGREVGGVSFTFTENSITDSATEGFYIETNSGINQQLQARLSNTGLPSDNLLPPYDPTAIEFFGTHRAVELNRQRYDGDDFPWLNMYTDIVSRLTVTNNIIRDNGNLVDSHGLFINVGTNSYIAADVQSNIFGGNVLSDFHTDSFVSAGNPANAVNTSGAGTFDLVTLDDSAQLDLRFALNTGDHIAVDAIGALYTNNDPAKQNPGNGLNGNGTGPSFTREFSATNRRADIFRVDNAPGLNFPNNDFNQFGVQQNVRLGPEGFTQNGYIEVDYADPLFPSFGFPSDQTVFISDLQVNEGNSGTSTASFIVSLGKPATEIVTVTYAVTNNTATANVDFTPVSGTLIFNPGELTKNIDVPIIGDVLDEENEFFHVTLLTSVNATIIDGLAIGTIIDDDAAPEIFVSDAATVIEGDSGTTNAVFTITLSKASARVITTNYAAAFGTATVEEDYVATTGSLTFNPGETSKVVVVPIKGDLIDEDDESFVLYLIDTVNADLGDPVGEVIIQDDDGPPGITILDVTIPPAPGQGVVQAAVVVNLSGASGKTITVEYNTANGTAMSGSDYVAKSGTLTFSPGETTKTILIDVVGNTLNELDENFFVQLTNGVNAVILDNSATVDVQGDSLAVNGTGAVDTFAFAINGQVTVTVNGLATNYALNRYRRFLLDGLAGADIIQIHGTTADESVVIHPGQLTWTGTNLLVDAKNFTTVDVFGGGGTDSATFYDTPGDDLFTSIVTMATLTGSGLTHRVHQFANIAAYAYAGGNDLAEFYDTTGVDRFIGRETRSNMTGDGYNHSATRFERVNAYAYKGGYDMAYLHGSAGNDRFNGRKSRSSLRSTNYFNMAFDFEGVYAFAKPGGNDTALIIDTAGDDTYFGTSNTGMLSGHKYFNQVFDFKDVEVQATTGNDKAEVIDVETLDTVFGSGNLFELTRVSQKDRLTGFDEIKARSKTGHTPTANILAVDYAFIPLGTWL